MHAYDNCFAEVFCHNDKMIAKVAKIIGVCKKIMQYVFGFNRLKPQFH